MLTNVSPVPFLTLMLSKDKKVVKLYQNLTENKNKNTRQFTHVPPYNRPSANAVSECEHTQRNITIP